MELVSYMYSGEWHYGPGMIALAYSLKEMGHLPNMTWNIIWSGDPVPGVTDAVSRFGFHVVERAVSEFDIYQSFGKESAKKHLKRGEVWNKLAYLLMPEGKRYAFIDVDILCLNDATEMLSLPHFSFPQVFIDKKVKRVSTHFYVASPIQELYDEVDALLPTRKSWPLHDETLLNEYIKRHQEDSPDLLNGLDSRWDTNKRWERKFNKDVWRQHLEEAVLLHYSGLYKPWFDGTWKYVSEEDYPESHALWHEIAAEAARGRGGVNDYQET